MQIRMVRERIADDIYVFTSSEYAQVTAGAIVTKDGVILVDTLYFPHETQAIKEFFEIRLGVPVRYVINTHYHADHTQGTYLFPEAQVISHALCRQLLDTVGRQGLAEAQEEDPELEAVRIELPDMIFSEGMVSLQVGGKTLELWHMPGHSPDVIGVFVTNDRILFASDNMMPVPTLFDGSYTDLARSLQRILEIAPDMIVQGHGEVILRGEMQTAIQSDLDYLAAIRTAVEQVVTNGNTPDSLREIDIESCGKSRIPLNGLVSDLHQANLETMYREMNGNR
ncbi:MAG TPA: MBL fold metallo-hydrolase [Anaerolineae bacterium]|nr:MBL fold metallo-hydrolase [Anaerolineae bacterium]